MNLEKNHNKKGVYKTTWNNFISKNFGFNLGVGD
jgi:hypothetical protein